MFTTAKSIVDYIAYLFPFRKTKWGLTAVLMPIAVLWVLRILPIYNTDKYQFMFWSSVFLGISLALFLLWMFYSRRIILANDIFTVVLSLKSNDPKSNTYIQNAISMLKPELDKMGLLSKLKILLAGSDIIDSIEKAHSYRENFNIDLLIWGEVFSGKKNEKDLCDFKKLLFTCKIPPKITHANLTDLFKSDINIALTNRDWNVYEFNSLPDLEKITGHLSEVIMFVMGIIYAQTNDYAEDSVIILENLFNVLDDKSKNEQIIISNENKTMTMSSTLFRKGRVLAILLQVYKNLGLYYINNKKYMEARFYLKQHWNHDPKNIHVLGGLAICSFYLDDYESGKQYTDEMSTIDNHNQVYLINKAFWGIWEKNYSSALHFYSEFIKRGRVVTRDVVTNVISFLDERKCHNVQEIGYDFAIGLLNHQFLQKSTGEKELRRFIKLAKNKQEYREMVSFLQTNILKTRKKG